MKSLIQRDLKLAFRSGGGFTLTLAFFLIVVMFVPFGVGANAELLARIAPGILWIGALLYIRGIGDLAHPFIRHRNGQGLGALDHHWIANHHRGRTIGLSAEPTHRKLPMADRITFGRHPDPFLHRRVRCGDHRRHKTGRLVTVPVGSTPLHPNLNAGRTGRNSGDAKPLTVAGTCRRYFAFMHCADPKRLRHSATRKFTLTKVTTCLFHCGRKRIETPHVFMGIRKSSQVHGAFRTHPACDYNCIGGYVANRTDLGVLFYTS